MPGNQCLDAGAKWCCVRTLSTDPICNRVHIATPNRPSWRHFETWAEQRAQSSGLPQNLAKNGEHTVTRWSALLCPSTRSWPCTRARHHTKTLPSVLALLKVQKNGQKKRATNVLQHFAKRVEKRCCAFYHPSSNLLTTWSVARQVLCGWYSAQHRYSTRFAASWKIFVARFSVPKCAGTGQVWTLQLL